MNNNNRTNGFSVRCVAVLDSRCLHLDLDSKLWIY
ncbi:hypothetical protein CMU89_14905 [Elizabethkingia anophelis]|nr:hypothetical protein [Elizabethkingia anophelis]MDV3543933.1 hypothetical protein [Elizabethkingia anophelis]MDV3954210.1 hypothetical protein [Elizabethkingia anophelis]MDV4010704.1 hypothetical protein [Elizabethkingia anophelis]PRQ78371.1 hypothetical protein CMT60_18370 [Elizabethkingia anophelis]